MIARTITLGRGDDDGISYTISSNGIDSVGIHQLKKIGAYNRKLRTTGDMVHDGIDFNTIDGLFGNTKPPGYTGGIGGDTMVDEYKKSLKSLTDTFETLYPKLKKLTSAGSWSPELRIMEAIKIVCETGLAPSKIAQSPCTTYDNPSQGLDPGSSLNSDASMMESPNNFTSITLDETFFELFQFPIGMSLIITSTLNPAIFDITLYIDEIEVKGRLTRQLINGKVHWECSQTKDPPFDLCPHLQNCSNNNKKGRFAGNADYNERIILLILKELGDFLQVIFYLIWFLSEKTNEGDAFDEASWKKEHAMITTDSVVYNLCKEIGLSSVYTGSTAGSGYINLYKYMEVVLTPEDYKEMFNNLKKCHLQEILNYNNSVLFILRKIMLGQNDTWAIPFLEDNDIKFIDGVNFMRLNYRSGITTVDGTVISGDIIKNSLIALLRSSVDEINGFNQALVGEITGITDGTIPTTTVFNSIADVNYQIGLFVQEQEALSKRTSIIFTTEIIRDLLTGTNTPGRMYFICPLTPLYDNICEIFFPRDQNGTITVSMGRQARRLRKIQDISELSEARRLYMNNSFSGGGFPNPDKFIQLDDGPNIKGEITLPTGQPLPFEQDEIEQSEIDNLQQFLPDFDYSKNSDGEYADFDTRNLDYDLRNNLQNQTNIIQIGNLNLKGDFNYVFTITCMMYDLDTTGKIYTFEATPPPLIDIFSFSKETKDKDVKKSAKKIIDPIKLRKQRAENVIKQNKTKRAQEFEARRGIFNLQPIMVGEGGSLHKRKNKPRKITQKRSLHKKYNKTLKKNKRPVRKTQRTGSN